MDYKKEFCFTSAKFQKVFVHLGSDVSQAVDYGGKDGSGYGFCGDG